MASFSSPLRLSVVFGALFLCAPTHSAGAQNPAEATEASPQAPASDDASVGSPPAREAAVTASTQGLELGARIVPPGERRTGATPLQLALLAPARLAFWTGDRQDILGVGVAVISDAARRVQGLQAAGIYHHATQRVTGAQIAGLVATNDGSHRGVQIAGLYVRTSGDAFAIQIAGIKTVHAGVESGGISIAGFKNESLADFTGIQLAACVNETSGRVTRAVQAAILNYNESPRFGGLQLGLVNYTEGDFSGLAIGGFNVAVDPSRHGAFAHYGDVSGVTIGIVNVGNYVRGAQIGVVNVARRGLRGVQLGAINLGGALPFTVGINAGWARRPERR